MSVSNNLWETLLVNQKCFAEPLPIISKKVILLHITKKKIISAEDFFGVWKLIGHPRYPKFDPLWEISFLLDIFSDRDALISPRLAMFLTTIQGLKPSFLSPVSRFHYFVESNQLYWKFETHGLPGSQIRRSLDPLKLGGGGNQIFYLAFIWSPYHGKWTPIDPPGPPKNQNNPKLHGGIGWPLFTAICKLSL